MCSQARAPEPRFPEAKVRAALERAARRLQAAQSFRPGGESWNERVLQSLVADLTPFLARELERDR